jgi:amino acid adenylation domain-containing protein
MDTIAATMSAPWFALREVATRFRRRIAVDDAAGSVTFGQFAERAGQIARALRAEDVAGSCVGVLLDRTRDLPASMFAVGQAGATYLPLAVNQPDARLHAIVGDAQPACVITDTTHRHRIPDGQRVLTTDTLAPTGPRRTTPPMVADCAYVMYTSGSSGPPKGVLVGQEALANFCAALDADLGTAHQQTWLAHASVGYDASVPEMLWTLSRGHRVCLVDGDPLSIMTSALAQRAPDGPRVSHMLCTPSLVRLLVEHDGSARGLRDLDTLVLGGEPFPADLVPRLRGAGGGPRLLNRYGPTEATVWIAGATCTGAGQSASVLTVTTPNTWVRIVDGALHPVPVGATGRLLIGGRQVALGYLNRGQLTRERFIRGTELADGTMFDTGDLAHRVGESQFVITGRNDDQIKISGHRVELGEVESAIRAHPQVRDVVCVPDATPTATSITALVVAGSGVTAEELREWLAPRIPSHMRPTRIVSRAELPMTPSGKVDRVRAAGDVNQ